VPEREFGERAILGQESPSTIGGHFRARRFRARGPVKSTTNDEASEGGPVSTLTFEDRGDKTLLVMHEL